MSHNIIFFYSRITGYLESTLHAIVKLDPKVNIDVVYWDHKAYLPYSFEIHDRIKYYKRSENNEKNLLNLLLVRKPSIIYSPGWMDTSYLKAIYKYKKVRNDVKVVAGIDDQWKGSFRQYVGKVLFYFVLSNLFDYLWVAGKPQYHYAKMMGYSDRKIIHNLLSANTNYFNKRVGFKQRLVFLGRFSKEKGIFNLIETYNNLPSEIRQTWELVLIGDGPLKKEIIESISQGITVKPFMEKDELINELSLGGVFCLPSNLFEMWGVVIHELALLGYPMLLSNICGGVSEFLIEGYNGFSFDPNNKDEMLKATIKITNLSIQDLEEFSIRSQILGSRINSEICAASLLSVIKH